MAFALCLVGRYLEALALGLHQVIVNGLGRIAPARIHVTDNVRDVVIRQVAHRRHHAVVLDVVDLQLAGDSLQHRGQHRGRRVRLKEVRTRQRRERSRKALAIWLVAGSAIGEIGRLPRFEFVLGWTFVGNVAGGDDSAQCAQSDRQDQQPLQGSFDHGYALYGLSRGNAKAASGRSSCHGACRNLSFH